MLSWKQREVLNVYNVNLPNFHIIYLKKVFFFVNKDEKKKIKKKKEETKIEFTFLS